MAVVGGCPTTCLYLFISQDLKAPWYVHTSSPSTAAFLSPIVNCVSHRVLSLDHSYLLLYLVSIDNMCWTSKQAGMVSGKSVTDNCWLSMERRRGGGGNVCLQLILLTASELNQFYWSVFQLDLDRGLAQTFSREKRDSSSGIVSLKKWIFRNIRASSGCLLEFVLDKSKRRLLISESVKLFFEN